ncbi:DUF6286 domain-containing protein [Acidimicrobiia bacterium EGI L10123]|uniref:DUF6286 domain-containing protein n=1 Tax=Salinilacustrithrix flava TaxID=2957203 RepID=UPI003D7C3083|nr:DUF6286 domain-containing protein [Acidimicrobiia bacterium EGI L10123]
MTLLRRFLALVVALALAATAGIVIAEAVGIRIGESPVLLPIDEWEQRLTTGDWRTWSADAWTIASAIVLGVGLLLVALQLIPHRTTTLDRKRADGEREVRFGRSGLNERLRDLVVDEDGVLGGKAKVAKRKTKVTARIPDGADPKPAEQSVRAAVREEIDRLRLAKKQRVRVDAVHTDDRVI